jgi:hypothetical protein
MLTLALAALAFALSLVALFYAAWSALERLWLDAVPGYKVAGITTVA